MSRVVGRPASRPAGAPAGRRFGAVARAAGAALAVALAVAAPPSGVAGQPPPPGPAPRWDLVSADPAGAGANGASRDAAVSADGRTVVFRSEANDLVPGAGAGAAAVYTRDLATRGTRLAGVVWAGNLTHLALHDAPAVSGDGRVVAFRSVSGAAPAGEERLGIFVWEAGGPPSQVDLGPGGAPPDGLSSAPSLSHDGRLVAFHSWATNLVPGDDNGRPDVFVHDRQAGTTRLVSRGVGGRPARGTSMRPWLAGGGGVVVWESDAPDVVPGDGNGRVDVFATDLDTGVVERVSVATRGGAASRDSHSASVSADGRFVAFASDAGELSPSAVAGAPAVYLRDRRSGTTTLVPVPFDGGVWNGSADQPAVAPDGCCVAFRSTSRHLVPGKADDEPEIFVFERRTGVLTRHRPVRADDAYHTPVSLGRGALAAGARVIALTTGRALAPVDRNTVEDVYALVVRDLDRRVWLPMAGRDLPGALARAASR